MTNKLVAIINSLKVSKIKKILLYEMKFLLPNYSCLQNPWLEGYRPQIPVLSVLCPQLNLLNNPPPQTKFLDTPLVYTFGNQSPNWLISSSGACSAPPPPFLHVIPTVIYRWGWRNKNSQQQMCLYILLYMLLHILNPELLSTKQHSARRRLFSTANRTYVQRRN